MNNPKFPLMTGLLALAFFTGCATIARFDQFAYSQATSLKVDALSLMDSATGPYIDHQPAVANIQTSIEKIYEYEKNRPKNTLSENMWALLKDTSGHLYGGFLTRWKKEGRLDRVFIDESKRLIGQSFDQISQLESGKIKPAQASIQ